MLRPALALLLSFSAASAAVAQTAPAKPPSTPPPAGQRGFMMVGERALAFVPAQASPQKPVPLLLLFHPAGGTAQGMMKPFLLEADKRGIALLAFQSKAVTWDLVATHFKMASQEATLINQRDILPAGDRRLVEAALAQFQTQVPIDRTRIAALGMSDGAGYALSYGAANLSKIAWSGAISPKFGVIPRGTRGRGHRVFIVEGKPATGGAPGPAQAEVCPEFARSGFAVRFAVYVGGYDLPPEVAATMLDDWLEPESRPAPDSAAYNCGGTGKRTRVMPAQPEN